MYDVLPMTAVRNLSALDGRRGVVRLHPEALVALGLTAWSVVTLTGARATGALVAYAPPGGPPGDVLCDDLLLGNLGVRAGAQVTVDRASEQPAQSLVVTGSPEVVALLTVDLVRDALHGKVVTTGDSLSLVQQDLRVSDGLDLAAVRRRLRADLGARAGTVLLHAVATSPAGPVLVTRATQVSWQGAGTALPATATPETPRRTAVLPGLESHLASLVEWFDLGLHRADLLARLGTEPRMGVLLTGAAGSGKASLVETAAAEVGAQLVRAWAPELAAAPDAASVRDLFDVGGSGPTVLLIEDVEALCPRDQPPPLATVFLAALREAVAGGRLAVVCTTARPEQVDLGLRSPGLLDHELGVPLLDAPARRRLFEQLAETLPLADGVDLADLAARTPGFVAADLLSLLHEAGLVAAARQRDVPEPQLTAADLDEALEVVRPTGLAGGGLSAGGLTLDDVGDMVPVKAALTEAVLWPLQYPDTFARLGVSAPGGALLYGPPGCGKTFLVRALAGTGQVNVLSVKGAELLSKWVGASEQAVRELFRKAREAGPSLIFLDEVDALAPPRGRGTDGGTTDRVVAALLTELDGVEARRDVVVIGATNRPDLIDPAVLRPGRLEKLVYVPPPDAEARTAILTTATRAVPLADDVDLVALGGRTEGFSAADCAALVREAALTAMRASMAAAVVTAAHVETALSVVRPSLDPAQVAALQAFAEAREQR